MRYRYRCLQFLTPSVTSECSPTQSPPIRSRWFFQWLFPCLLGLAILTLQPAPAQAVCNISTPASPANFGIVNALSRDHTPATIKLTVTCQSETPGSTIFMCVAIKAGTNPGYQLFSDRGHTQIWGDAQTSLRGGAHGFTIAVDENGSATMAKTIYARPWPKTTTNGSHHVLYGYGGGITAAYAPITDPGVNTTPNNCTMPYTENASQATRTETVGVAAAVTDSCRLNKVFPIDFDPHTILDQTIRTVRTLAYRCTVNSIFNLSFSAGNWAEGEVRYMKQVGGDEKIRYDLYNDTYISPIAMDDPVATTGANDNRNDIETQFYYIYALVPARTLPPPGIYKDTVVITLTY